MNDNITNITEGIHRFSQEHCQSDSIYNQTVENGQTPKIMVVSCSDSLVPPEQLMGVSFGEIFVHRNIGGFIPPYKENKDGRLFGTIAALEHGVRNLEVEDLIIMGHGNCGGVKNLLSNNFDVQNNSSFISSWVQIAAKAKSKVLENHSDCSAGKIQNLCEKESVVISLQNIMTFPWVQERVKSGKLTIHGWHFNKGTLSKYNLQKKSFEVKDMAL